MSECVAFLRAVNVSGKNKINMADLKKEFLNVGFENVKTFLNSGNILFSTEEKSTDTIESIIGNLIKEKFNLTIQVLVILKNDLLEIFSNSPDWWGKGELYDNLILLFPETTFKDLYEKIGEPNKELEKIENYKNAIFWSFDRVKYSKTVWWSKTASQGINNLITIRTAGTIKKILGIK